MTKTRLKKYKYIIIPLICILVCCALYVAGDYFANGAIVDWLNANFTYERFVENSDSKIEYIHDINWSAVKMSLLSISIIFTVSLSLLILLLIKINTNKNTIAVSHRISDYIDRCILNDEPLPAEIPQEYAETFTKISEVKMQIQQTKNKLTDENERKNNLITYLAHDLKTPLTSVIGYLTLLNEEKEISEKQRQKYISVALSKAERLEDLTNELFEITRFNIADIELQTEEVNLSKMIEQIAYEFKPLLKDKNLKINSDIEENIQIICDTNKIERVIDNLIRNAINYCCPDTAICISLHQCGSDVVLKFKNKGKTIPDEKLSRIFEDFYKIDSSRNSANGGSGLGLAIAKKIVEASGGKITAQSSNETIVFTVILPKNHKNV